MKTFRFVLLLFLVLSISNTAWAQNQTVKGRVMDSKLKEPLMGVEKARWYIPIFICLNLQEKECG